MKYQVYIDVIFFVNFIMDYIIIKVTAKLLKQPKRIIRELLAAAIGGIGVSSMYLFPSLYNVFRSMITYTIIIGVVAMIAFKPKSIIEFIKQYLLLFGVTVMLGGIMNFLYYSSNMAQYFNYIARDNSLSAMGIKAFLAFTILSVLILNVLTTSMKEQSVESKYMYIVSMEIDGNKRYGTGLMDTGNYLVDVVTGKPVIITSYSFIGEMLKKDYKYILDKYFQTGNMDYDYIACNSVLGIREIDYKTIGNDKGKIPIIKCDKLIIKRDNNNIITENIMVGVSNSSLSVSNGYDVILNKKLLVQEEV